MAEQAALAAVGTSEPPGPKPEMESVKAGVPVQCGDWRVRLGSTGAITSLTRSGGLDSAHIPATDWASETHPIGEFVYQTFTSGKYPVQAETDGGLLALFEIKFKVMALIH